VRLWVKQGSRGHPYRRLTCAEPIGLIRIDDVTADSAPVLANRHAVAARVRTGISFGPSPSGHRKVWGVAMTVIARLFGSVVGTVLLAGCSTSSHVLTGT